jgi:thiol-disulfide isomerase/thioredoxin
MKKRLQAFLFILLPAALLAQPGKYVLTGHIGNASAPGIAYLLYSDEGTVVQDSTFPSKGVFVFRGTLDHPVKGTLMIKHWSSVAHPSSYSDKIQIYLEKGNITLTSPDSLLNATFSGSPLNKDLRELQASMKPVSDAGQKAMAPFAAMPEEKRNSPEGKASIEAAYKEFQDGQKEVMKAFILRHPASLVSLFALKTYAGAVPEYAAAYPLFDGLSSAVKNSHDGKAYGEQLAKVKITSIGSVAPDFVQNDVDGHPVKLSSFRGKYVLVDFWASWCGPCRAENPNVVKLYHQYKDKDFTVLGVSLDQADGRDKWMRAIADDHLEWTQVSDLSFWKNAAAALYGVKAIPQNFLLDPQGKIIGKNLRGDELAHKLATLL